MPRYEWDEEKERKNIRNHHLSLRDGWTVYEHPNKVTVDDPYPHEERFRDFGAIEGRVRVLIYAMRNDVVRCISFRRATRKEEEQYYEEINNR